MKKSLLTILALSFLSSLHAAEITTIKETPITDNDKKAIVVDIYAPEAVTKSDREATLKLAAQSYEAKGYEFIQVILRPSSHAEFTNNFGSLGIATYSVDGCNLQGLQCKDEKWNIKVTDYILTEKDYKNINDVVNDVKY